MTTGKQLHHIGYVHSTQGLRGELFLALKSIDSSWFDKWHELDLCGVESQDNSQKIYLRFKVKSFRLHKKQGKQGVIVSLQEFSNVDEVSAYVGHTVWIPKDFLESKEGEGLFLKEIEGFAVVDEKLGEVGPIVGFASNGVQDLIEIAYKEKTYYVPLVKAFILSIDKKNKKLFMSIPEGLLDL